MNEAQAYQYLIAAGLDIEYIDNLMSKVNRTYTLKQLEHIVLIYRIWDIDIEGCI